MSKAKMIAVSAMCAAVVLGCLLLAALPGVKWLVLMLGVIASISTVIPLMLNVKNIVYTLLVYVAGSVLGVFLGISNVVYVAPIVAFCIPFAIVKVYGETVTVTAQVSEEKVLEDPFGNGDDKKMVAVKVDGKTKLHKVVKWILYYLLLEAGLGLTTLATYLFTPAVFESLTSSKWFWWSLGALQLIVYPYDFLMSGCLYGAAKVLQKAVKPQ